MFRMIALLAALTVSSSLVAQDQPQLKLCVGSFNSEGLDVEAAAAFRDKLVDEIGAAGAELVPLPRRSAKSGPDFKDPRCLERGAAELGASGALTVQLFRLGPLVRVKLSAKDGGSGETVAETLISAPSAGFPGSVKLGAELAKLLAKLKPIAEPPPAVASNDPEEVDPTPPPPPPPPPPTLDDPEPEPGAEPAVEVTEEPEGGGAMAVIGFGGLGLGGLLLAGGAVVGGMTLSLDQDLRSVCSDGACPPDRQGDIQQLNTLAWTTNGLLGAGLLVAAASAVALLFAGD